VTRRERRRFTGRFKVLTPRKETDRTFERATITEEDGGGVTITKPGVGTEETGTIDGPAIAWYPRGGWTLIDFSLDQGGGE
jgi:hypothetical protein